MNTSVPNLLDRDRLTNHHLHMAWRAWGQADYEKVRAAYGLHRPATNEEMTRVAFEAVGRPYKKPQGFFEKLLSFFRF